MLLGLFLKTQHQVPDHLDFLLDYLLGFLQFTSRSVIHFEWIFVKTARSVSRFIFLTCGCPAVSICGQDLLSPLGGLCSNSQRSVDYNRLDLYSKLSILSQWSMCLYFHHYRMALITVALQYVLKSGSDFSTVQERKGETTLIQRCTGNSLHTYNPERTEDREAAQEVHWDPRVRTIGHSFQLRHRTPNWENPTQL